MVQISQLKRGDIILIREKGKPFHAAIYAPDPRFTGDIVHMGVGFKRSGAIRSSFTNIYRSFQEINRVIPNVFDVQVIRSKKLTGEDIALQAEYWMLQGVIYDEKRLADTIEEDEIRHDTSIEAQTVNIFEYLKFAARRKTAPIKTPYFPHAGASFFSVIGTFFQGTPLNWFKTVRNFGLRLIRYGTNYDDLPEERIKGFTCVGFPLAVCGAVALQDEIQEVAPGSWVSLKYGGSPENKESNYAKALRVMQTKKGIEGDIGTRPGLHTLLTSDQIQNFNIARLQKKLGILALQHPHKPNLNTFVRLIHEENDDWENLGILDTDKLYETKATFDKKAYRAERKSILQEVQKGHQQFGQLHGDAAFSDRTYQLSFFKTVVSYITGESISTISHRKTL